MMAISTRHAHEPGWVLLNALGLIHAADEDAVFHGQVRDFFSAVECADVAMQSAHIVKAAVDDRMRVPFSKIEAGRYTTG